MVALFIADIDAANTTSVIIWSLVLVVLILAGFVAVSYVKKRLRNDDDAKDPARELGFTLSDLRQLHRSGQISDEEFARAKGKIVAAARRMPGER